MQDMEFIRATIGTMLEGKQQETKQKIIQSAAQYAKLRKFPAKLTEYNDDQLTINWWNWSTADVQFLKIYSNFYISALLTGKW